MTQPEALRLADSISRIDTLTEHQRSELLHAAAELRRLYADAEESEALRERLSALLKSTAIALRGPEPKLTRWGWHDLPERVATLKSQRDELLQALERSRGQWIHSVNSEQCLAAIAKAQQ